ncbi:MAG: response regulator, partial [Marinicellaceae bacterium]
LELELELEDDLESESEEDLELELELEENLESESEEDLEFELEEDLELESEEDLELETEEELESESEEDLELEEDLETEIREDQKEDVTADASEDLEHISATISTSYDDKDESDHDMSHEFDEELLEIFKEEADDILDRTEHVLSDLEENPKDSSLILALQRDLHTLKGGARMAGLENIGNLGHVLESLLEIIGEENRNVDKPTLEAIQESFDLLNKMKELKDYGESFDVTDTLDRLKHLVGDDDVIPEESKLDLDYLAPIDPQLDSLEDEIEIVDEVQTSTRKANVLSGNQIKVRSELLDNLVNYAGEVSIYRSRLEQEVGSFRVNLSELGNTVARIKEQLRKLDAETEAQIISTFQTVDDDEGFDPLEMDRFSQLQQLSRSLTESVSDLTSIHSYLDDVARTSDNLLTQQSRVNTELQEGLMETRLVSFNSIVPRLRRLVRTTSKELDKPVKLDVNGAEGEMDKTVLEGVIAPLEHMLRNSLAHGIESDRNKANKPAKGSINIDVRREATEVVISIADDGAGINRDKVKKLAEEKGLIKKDAIISDENIDRLILNSGFSTVDEVSKLAGRGVGMDVVGNQINLLGGTLDIRSKPNQGTIFSIRLPYTLALSSALLVEVSETIYAIPVSGLEGIIRMSYPDYQQRIKDKNYIYEYANEEYDIQELNTLLDVESEVIVENNQIPLVMIRSGDNGVALRVDNILGSREIVVKTVGSQISSVPGIYGATILGDGNVVLILDVIPLSRAYAEKLANIDDSVPVIEIEEIEKDPVIMIVDDSITMRKVGERILRRNEYDVETAKDGLDALEQLSEVIPDVMLLDIEMPRMDGYELAIEMKKEEKYADIPIIMITSRTGEKHRQKAMDLGVDRYLGKPYQEADLLENIRELIESKKY